MVELSKVTNVIIFCRTKNLFTFSNEKKIVFTTEYQYMLYKQTNIMLKIINRITEN